MILIQAACDICEKIILLLRAHRLGMISLGSGNEVFKPSERCDTHQRLVASALALDDQESSLALSEAITFIRQIRIVKFPPNPGAIVVADMLSSSPVPRLPLSALYIPEDPSNPEGVIGGRSLHPEWIDVRLPALWKDACARLHDGLCKSHPVQTLASITPSWLIDVRSQCLVRAPDGCSYVALSYVWGNQRALQTLLSNQDQLQQPGSLSLSTWEPPISTTTRNAMGVVNLLGERYLWVDALCIVQDDESQKHRELARMGAIYANASVTIMAVQGEHANCGLRGFRGISEPRGLRQVIHRLAGGVRALQYPVEAENYELACEYSLYATRGWTYQEHLFSRRKLIFDGDSLRWECSAAIWREHVEFSTCLHPFHNNITSCQLIFGSLVPDFNAFQGILRNYNIRDFTYPEDALDAFAGISSAMGWSVGGNLVAGLPIASFDIFLVWQPETRVVRRAAREPEKKYCLPSWSWAGWSGSVKMDVASASDFIRNCPRVMMWGSRSVRVTRLVSWKYHLTPESPGIPIQPSILKCREEWLEGRGGYAPGWTTHPVSESPQAKYEMSDPSSPSPVFFRHPMHPGFDFWYPIPLPGHRDTFNDVQAPYLSCRTWRASLFPAEKIQRIYGPPLISLRDQAGIWVGALQPHDGIDERDDAPRWPSEAIALVEIAKGFCRDTTSPHPGLQEMDHPEKPKNGDWYEYYWVMWVEWTHGIAYRKGLGRVCKQVWETQSKEQIELMLG